MTDEESATVSSAETRAKSTVQFPYNPISDAEEVSRKINDTYGGSCEVAQLAGAFGQTTTSGTFRNKVLAAKMFGFVSGTDTLALTPLGRQLVVTASRRSALAEGFLKVELYGKIFEDVKPSGGTLPKRAGLESLIQRFGVVPKQVEKARQVFERSAKEAGYFEHGTDRLVRPAVIPQSTPPTGDNGGGEPGGDSGGKTITDDPLIVGLLAKLPAPGSVYPRAERIRWLNALKVNFDFIYESEAADDAPFIIGNDDLSQEEHPIGEGLADVFRG